MPAWYCTIQTPLGESHMTVRSTDMKTAQDAVDHIHMLQQKRSWKGHALAPEGDVTAEPAIWPDHFRKRPAALDAAYPAPLTKAQLTK
jgi:hypothetical protein